jgi:hypothetical protein
VLAPERPDETMQDIIARMVRLAPEYGLTTLPDYPCRRRFRPYQRRRSTCG